MKTTKLKRELLGGGLGSALFFTAYFLVGGFKSESSFASNVGYVIFWGGCWAIVDSIVGRWMRLPKPKKREEIDPYTAALVEMELERKMHGAEPSASQRPLSGAVGSP